MALDDLATHLNSALDDARVGSFEAAPYYDESTDSLVYYERNVRSHGKRVNRYLTVYLAIDDDTLVGFKIKEYDTIKRAVENLGAIPIAPPVKVTADDGATVPLVVLVWYSLLEELPPEPPAKTRIDEINRMSSGVKVPRRPCPV